MVERRDRVSEPTVGVLLERFGVCRLLDQDHRLVLMSECLYKLHAGGHRELAERDGVRGEALTGQAILYGNAVVIVSSVVG